MPRCCWSPIALCAALIASPALAVTPRVSHEYGQEYVTIGRPGNRAALPEERAYPDGFFGVPRPRLGRVNYRYRIATTEVTASQWLGFVEAFDPIWIAEGGTRFDSGFTSDWIRPTSYDPDEPAEYFILPDAADRAIRTSWRLAAQYINWLNNGQSSDPGAFASGAYHTSTFTQNQNGTFNDQPARTSEAQFWLPTLDEWTKAAHYDPDRHGAQQEGYWLGQGSTDSQLAPGLPDDGGETSAGNFLPLAQERMIDVESYPAITSPWGLFDTSGGVREWTETIISSDDPSEAPHSGGRIARGSEAGQSLFFLTGDVIDYFSGYSPTSYGAGIRVAAAIPSPTTLAFALPIAHFLRRHR